MATRLPSDGPTTALAEELVTGLTVPHLRAITAFLDLPHPALFRVLTGHTNVLRALAGAPDGSWLTLAGHDGTVRIWSPTTGATRHTVTCHTDWVAALVDAPDGSWLASADNGGEVWIWSPSTGVSLTALRVADRLYHLQASTTIVAAGERGPYFLSFCDGIEPR